MGRINQLVRLLERLREEWGSAARAKKDLLLGVLLAGVFVGGYWNTRNWALTGNPF